MAKKKEQKPKVIINKKREGAPRQWLIKGNYKRLLPSGQFEIPEET